MRLHVLYMRLFKIKISNLGSSCCDASVFINLELRVNRTQGMHALAVYTVFGHEYYTINYTKFLIQNECEGQSQVRFLSNLLHIM